MTTRTIGILLLKLWGLLSLVEGFALVLNAALAPLIADVFDDPAMQRYALMASALSAVTHLALGTALLVAAERIVAWIDPPPDPSAASPPGRFTLAELQGVVFAGVGVFLALSALREIGELVYAIARQPAWDSANRFTQAMETRQEELAGAAVQLIFACILLLKRDDLAAFWSRLRGR